MPGGFDILSLTELCKLLEAVVLGDMALDCPTLRMVVESLPLESFDPERRPTWIGNPRSGDLLTGPVRSVAARRDSSV